MLTAFKFLLFIIIFTTFAFIVGKEKEEDVLGHVGLCLASITALTMLFMFAW